MTRGLLDTSVLIDYHSIDPSKLPEESAVAAITLAELTAGPHVARDDTERARRQDRLLWAASTWDPLSFDAPAARAFGLVVAATRRTGRTSRTRLADLLIASTAIANDLAIYTRNPSDFAGLEDLLQVHTI